MLLTKKIKLEESEQDAATLEFMQGKCRGLYNWWVMRLRKGERWPGVYAARKTLKESRKHDPELNGVYNKLLQEVYFRLGKAMDAFFRRCQNSEKPGFPRVRPRHCFFTLCYPAMYLTIENGVLILPTAGKGSHKKYSDVRAKLTEQAPAEFGEVAISRDARDNYYASLALRGPSTRVSLGKSWPSILASRRLPLGPMSEEDSITSAASKAHAGIIGSSIPFAPSAIDARKGQEGISICLPSTSACRKRSATSSGIACIRHPI